MLIGGLRALIIQSLHPLALAGVVQHSDFRERPLHRLRRTAEYVATTTFADDRDGPAPPARASGASTAHQRHRPRHRDALPRGGPRDAPVGPLRRGPLVPRRRTARTAAGQRAEQDAYLAESAPPPSWSGSRPRTVPASRAEMRDYFDAMLPELVRLVEAERDDRLRRLAAADPRPAAATGRRCASWRGRRWPRAAPPAPPGGHRPPPRDRCRRLRLVGAAARTLAVGMKLPVAERAAARGAPRAPQGGQAGTASWAARLMPITFSRRVSAVNANAFVSSEE